MQTLDLMSQVSTSEERAEWLKGPLERAALQGNRGLAQKLVEMQEQTSGMNCMRGSGQSRRGDG